MTSPLILTAAWLQQHKACPEQVALFRRLFGDAAEVCPETLDRTLAAGLSVGWLAERLLNEAALTEYARVVAPAWAEYARVVAPAWAEYRRVVVVGAAWAESRHVTAPARAEYDRVIAAAWAEYRRVADAACAALLADPTNWKPEVLAELRRDV